MNRVRGNHEGNGSIIYQNGYYKKVKKYIILGHVHIILEYSLQYFIRQIAFSLEMQLFS